MEKLEVKTDSSVADVFGKYPDHIKPKMEKLRNLILETAEDLELVSKLEETLKWGEPSYLTKHGSTIRIDWKPKKPDQYAMYFKCTSKLVPAFKSVFGDVFSYEGNRAIVFGLEDAVPESPLKACIAAGFSYHKVKHLPLLGM